MVGGMTQCPRCGEALDWKDTFCSKCGTNLEVEREIDARYTPALKTARGWILAIGIIYVVSAMLVLALQGEYMLDEAKQLVIGTSVALCAIHVGLWWWARTAPFPAAVVALVLFLTVQAINIALDPSQAYKGVLIKALFLVALIKAVSAGLEAHKLRAQRS